MAKDLDLFQGGDGRGEASEGSRAAKPKAVVARPQAEGPPKSQQRSDAPAPPHRRRWPGPAVAEQTFDREGRSRPGQGHARTQDKLDLHGMTLAAAERAVTHFLADASERALRVVLIVTGKGMRLEGGRMFGGRIRAEFPAGSSAPRTGRGWRRAARPSAPRRQWRFYVLLRRRSSASSRSLRATPQR
jgi:hypothetical protein